MREFEFWSDRERTDSSAEMKSAIDPLSAIVAVPERAANSNCRRCTNRIDIRYLKVTLRNYIAGADYCSGECGSVTGVEGASLELLASMAYRR
jgi:hypothetical protein